MRVSLTTFIDFTTANGPTRVTVVTNAKKQVKKYRPARDYYRGIRNAIIDTLMRDLGKDHIEKVASLAHANRVAHYLECANGFQKWWGRKDIEWIDKPEPTIWRSGILEVRINPELLIYVNGMSHAIKMYFKKPELSKRRSDATIYLLEHAGIRSSVDTVGVLDVRRGKLFIPPTRASNLSAYLASEAAAFAAMWDALPEQ